MFFAIVLQFTVEFFVVVAPFSDFNQKGPKFNDCNSTLLIFLFITDGTTEKVSLFKMLLKLIYNKNICLVEQKFIFEHCRKVKTIKQ
jgi:hypothetical protein